LTKKLEKSKTAQKALLAGYIPHAHAKGLLLFKLLFACFTPCQHAGDNQFLLAKRSAFK